MTIKELVRENLPYVIELRRDFHMHPELSFQEERTSAKVCEELGKMGIPYEVVGRRNVVGVIDSGKPGKTIGIRGDMDALPVEETVDLPFKSQNPGVMHACGHDGHTSCLLGIAKTLNALREELTGKVLLCFEVAEEIGGGADEVVAYLKEQGGVDQVIGTHLWASEPVGTIKLFDGPFMAGNLGFTIKVIGQGGHGSRPDLAVDPLRPACDILLRIASIPVNRHNPFDTVVVSPCMINGGSKNNIIPGECVIQGNVRFFKRGDDQVVLETMRTIAENTAKAYGATAEVEGLVMAPNPVINDPEAAARGRALAERMGLTVEGAGEPNAGSDDFANFLAAFPGFYCNIGAKADDIPGGCGNHHNSNFVISEDAFPVAMEFLATYAYEYLQK